MTPRAVLPWCGSPERPSARTSNRRGLRAEAGAVCGELDTVHESNARRRILGEQEVAVEVDVVAEARDRRTRSDPEAGLDHAPEHHAEAQGPRGGGDLHRLADPAGLRELDVHAVRALRAG